MAMGIENWIALGAMLIAAASFFAASRRDVRGSAADQARTQEQLGSIKTGVDDIRVEMRSMRADMTTQGKKLVELEASCKSAHRRIDETNRKIEAIHPPGAQ